MLNFREFFALCIEHQYAMKQIIPCLFASAVKCGTIVIDHGSAGVHAIIFQGNALIGRFRQDHTLTSAFERVIRYVYIVTSDYKNTSIGKGLRGRNPIFVLPVYGIGGNIRY